MWSSPLNPDFTLTKIKQQEDWGVYADIFYFLFKFSFSEILTSDSNILNSAWMCVFA